MIIKAKLLDPLNLQIRNEFTNMFGYLAISAYFDDAALPELSAFFGRQSEDERLHAMKFVTFMLETGAKPLIPAIPAVKNDFKSAEEAVQYALDQEVKTTEQINNLVSIALAEGDYTTHNFLQWFVTEQVEEVDTMSRLLQTIGHAGGNLLRVEDYVLRNMPPVALGAAAGAA
jgi:bacterioferritin B